ncbi:MAG TPA: MBL fold metallo-hydrolase [Gemmatimonadaceae bacterium]|nr:MBL fold metallo-hydrolase [Gemmatimonadaceae bacterium]
MPHLPRSRVGRVLLALVTLVLVIVLVLLGSTGWLDSLGAAPTGARLARIQRSPNFRDGAFRNPDATRLGTPGSTWQMLRHWLAGDEQRVPPGPMPIARLSREDFARPPASGLRATWLGHATVLVEIDGARLLFDPVWARRASPSSLVGPERFHPPPLSLDDLPPLDAVVASHDHYDHLDRDVVRALARSTAQRGARFMVPLGVGAHLERWGVAPERITELDWSESTTVGALTLTATPARHFSGRGLGDRNHTLWASWSVRGPRHRVFHSGDTGPFAGFADIGATHGPFDLTLVKIGAYGETWPDIHLTPEQAVDAHAKLRGALLLPIHWGTFNLAFHAWDEPAERVVAAATSRNARLVMPKPGESIEPASAPTVERWWRSVR